MQIERGRETILQGVNLIRQRVLDTDRRSRRVMPSVSIEQLRRFMREYTLGTDFNNSIMDDIHQRSNPTRVPTRPITFTNMAAEINGGATEVQLPRLVYADTDSVMISIPTESMPYRMLMGIFPDFSELYPNINLAMSRFNWIKKKKDSIPSIRTSFPLTPQQIYILHNQIPPSIRCLQRNVRLAKIYRSDNNILSIVQKLYNYIIPSLNIETTEYLLYKLRKEVLRIDRSMIEDMESTIYNYNKLRSMLKNREYCGLCCTYQKNTMYVHDELHEKVCIDCFSKLEDRCPFCRADI